MEMVDFTRTLQIIDIDKIIDFENQIYSHFNKIYMDVWNEEKFKKQMPKKDSFSLFAIKNNKLVGLSIAYEFTDGWAHISKVAVNPNFNNKGIGKKMITEQVRYILKQGISKITIETSLFNRRALALFKKIGFNELQNSQLEKYISVRNRVRNCYIGNEKSHIVLFIKI